MIPTIREIEIRYGEPLPASLDRIGEAADVFKLLGAEMNAYPQEHFISLHLNNRNKIIARQTVSIGSVSATIVHPRDVFAPALRAYAVRLVVVHNHPSGDPKPSPEDTTQTTRLADCGHLLGIELLDHIIIGATGYYSFRTMQPFLFKVTI